MDIIACTKCGRSDVEFYWFMRRGMKKRHPHCKVCKKKANQDNWARKNGDDGTPLSSQMKIQRRERDRAYVEQSKTGKSCMDCHQIYPPYVMDYDHRDRSVKTASVSRMVHRGVSLSTLQNEIDKCDIVCANCHRERSHVGEHWKKCERRESNPQGR